jgi:hypothetical protein
MMSSDFKAFVDSGLVDFAVIDALAFGSSTHRFTSLCSGSTIEAGALDAPMLVFANYLFDSVPSDMYFCDGKGSVALGRTSTWSHRDSMIPNMKSMEITFDAPIRAPSDRAELLWAANTIRGPILVPTFGLRVLRGLNRLQKDSEHGVFGLLVADKCLTACDSRLFGDYPSQQPAVRFLVHFGVWILATLVQSKPLLVWCLCFRFLTWTSMVTSWLDACHLAWTCPFWKHQCFPQPFTGRIEPPAYT